MSFARRAVTRLIAAVALLAALAACSPGDGTGTDPVRQIVISPDTTLVVKGSTATLQVSARTASGAAASLTEVTWASEDSTVATVSSTGVVSAREYGRTSITATASGVTGRAHVYVVGSPGLAVVSGANVTDTIGAVLPQPLVVEVRDARGLPAAGVVVQLVSSVAPIPSASGLQVTGPQIRLAPAGTTTPGFGEVNLTTDTAGRAAARVSFAERAGPASVTMLVPTLGYADSARYTVLPGAPAALRLAPRDSAVFLGRTLTLRVGVFDRVRHALAEKPTLSARGPLSVDAEAVVGTSGHGAGTVEARLGQLVDSVAVAVVPVGALVASTVHNGLVVANFDGSGMRSIAPKGFSPAWSPSGDRVVYQSDIHGRLMTTTLSGPATVLPAETDWQHWPEYSPDGQWVYYFTDQGANYIRRVRPDGTSRERLTSSESNAQHPSPAPDGRRVAYASVNYGDGIYIRVRDLQTGAEAGNLARGHAPAWSPTSDLLAFNELEGSDTPRGVMLINADGTGLRRLTEQRFWFGLAWSPDGRWIIGQSGGRAHLIEVATGLTIRLPYPESVNSAAWRPGGLLP